MDTERAPRRGTRLTPLGEILAAVLDGIPEEVRRPAPVALPVAVPLRTEEEERWASVVRDAPPPE